MMRLLAFAFAACCYLQPVLALAEDTARQLVGSWKLNSWTIQIIGGEVTEPFGHNPKVRRLRTDGYVAFVIAAADRNPAANDEQSAALPKTLLAYTGKFTIEGDKFTTKVDISWNELLTGQDQVRFFKLEGDKLTIRTGEQTSAVFPGKRVVGALTWERVLDTRVAAPCWQRPLPPRCRRSADAAGLPRPARSSWASTRWPPRCSTIAACWPGRSPSSAPRKFIPASPPDEQIAEVIGAAPRRLAALGWEG